MNPKWLLRHPGIGGALLGVAVPFLLLAIWSALEALGLASLQDAFSSTVMFLFWPSSIMLLGSSGAPWPSVLLSILCNVPLYVLAILLLARIRRHKDT